MPPPQNHTNDSDYLESESNQSSVCVYVETLISSSIDDEIESNNQKSETVLPECVESVVRSTHRAAEGTTSRGAQNESEKTLKDDSGRERLKRHRVEVAGRVWIPDIWGQENCLKDWIDCTAFDSGLVNNNNSSIVSAARAALVEEGRKRRNSTRFRVVTLVD